MALYMLGTDVTSYMMKGTSPPLLERLRKHLSHICISVITQEAILVTNNIDHFPRILGLKIENLNVFVILFPRGIKIDG